MCEIFVKDPIFRSDLIRLAKLLMVSPAVILLGMDFYRRVATATDPQRQVTLLMITIFYICDLF